jgi:hypothetical protein
VGDSTGVRAVAARRRAERSAALAAAASYVKDVAGEVPVTVAVVFGSYARGDFNTWSDIDVLVVSDAFPPGFRERMDVLWRHRPPGIEPVGWTVAELAERRRRVDPIAVEADTVGVVVAGELP